MDLSLTNKDFDDFIKKKTNLISLCEPRRKIDSPELLMAIEESTIYVIVFSKNYASSPWCLDELCESLNVRRQEGHFGEGFARNYKSHKMDVWREALVEASNLSGWDLKTVANGYEAVCIKDIVQAIRRQLKQVTSVSVDENLVGLQDRRKEVISLLDGPDDVCMIGIRGMGGAGKTTLARALFDDISYHFDGLLLEDVTREENLRVRIVVDGKRMLIKRLGHKRVLLVLDDVDTLTQLEALAGELNWFGKGSRIVITTRDEHVLVGHGVEDKNIYKISLLNDNEASQLFKCYAFKRSIPSREYEEASQQVVHYATGLPLTLKVLGSFLCGKSLAEWTSVLNKLKKIPEKETIEILKISYDSLEHEYQEAFLHIACFFRGWKKDAVFRILESSELYPHIVISVLEQKSLINISNEHLWVHDLVQEMGKDIGTQEIKAIVVGDVQEIDSMNISEAFRNMEKVLYFHAMSKEMTPHGPEYLPNELRWLTWNHFSLDSLPESFHANKRVGLEMPHSKIKQLWDMTEVKSLPNTINKLHSLKTLDLHHCLNLEELPEKLDGLKHLENLTASSTGVRRLPDAISRLKHLKTLDLHHCLSIEMPLNLAAVGIQQNLAHLNLSCCIQLKEFPESIGNLGNLSKLDLSHNMIQELPSSIGNLTMLIHLNLTYCDYLHTLPATITRLKNLKTFQLHGCTSLESFPENLDQLRSLEDLIVSSTTAPALDPFQTA
ncbi:TMV resistance protein N-like [Bidens hawaiensis]|uniref:TMV resistance protein N-like n=1 Tax=Bidens hawaiensis TaxID=980011 RepID=UPI00404B7ECA